MFQKNVTYAIVDVETTGARAVSDRIIEIAIILVKEGKIIDTFRSLVNPEKTLNPFIASLTGIESRLLTGAPTFDSIAAEVHTFLSGSVFMAHNARFDYSFIKHELKRCGYTFSAKTVCSVKISRALDPKASAHNLDAIIDRYSIPVHSRHRAFDDALAIYQFLQKASEKHGIDVVESALLKAHKEHTLPASLSKKLVDDLTNEPGVYIFYGTDGEVLYVGKSKNIRTRVLSHFSGDYTSNKELEMCRRVESIETQVTAGELGALLLESHLIKTLHPTYNRLLRKKSALIALVQKINAQGYIEVSLERIQQPSLETLDSIVGVFRTMTQAKKYVEEITKAHALCPKLMHHESTASACFSYQLGTCKGACIERESTDTYNARAQHALRGRKMKAWPYKGPITLSEYNPHTLTRVDFVIDTWIVLRMLEYKDDELIAEHSGIHSQFDYDTYSILARYMLSKRKKALHTTTDSNSGRYGDATFFEDADVPTICIS